MILFSKMENTWTAHSSASGRTCPPSSWQLVLFSLTTLQKLSPSPHEFDKSLYLIETKLRFSDLEIKQKTSLKNILLFKSFHSHPQLIVSAALCFDFFQQRLSLHVDVFFFNLRIKLPIINDMQALIVKDMQQNW